MIIHVNFYQNATLEPWKQKGFVVQMTQTNWLPPFKLDLELRRGWGGGGSAVVLLALPAFLPSLISIFSFFYLK